MLTYLFMCVCMCVYIYVYVCIYVCACTCVYVCVCIYIYIYIYIHIYIYGWNSLAQDQAHSRFTINVYYSYYSLIFLQNIFISQLLVSLFQAKKSTDESIVHMHSSQLLYILTITLYISIIWRGFQALLSEVHSEDKNRTGRWQDWYTLKLFFLSLLKGQFCF